MYHSPSVCFTENIHILTLSRTRYKWRKDPIICRQNVGQRELLCCAELPFNLSRSLSAGEQIWQTCLPAEQGNSPESVDLCFASVHPQAIFSLSCFRAYYTRRQIISNSNKSRSFRQLNLLTVHQVFRAETSCFPWYQCMPYNTYLTISQQLFETKKLNVISRINIIIKR